MRTIASGLYTQAEVMCAAVEIGVKQPHHDRVREHNLIHRSNSTANFRRTRTAAVEIALKPRRAQRLSQRTCCCTDTGKAIGDDEQDASPLSVRFVG